METFAIVSFFFLKYETCVCVCVRARVSIGCVSLARQQLLPTMEVVPNLAKYPINISNPHVFARNPISYLVLSCSWRQNR